MVCRVAINGFGRMGRLALRAAWNNPAFQIVHINELAGDAATAAHLLKFDSVHGIWDAEISGGDNSLLIDGEIISYSQNRMLKDTPWADLGVDVVVDCTGSPDGLVLAMSLVKPRGTIVLKSTCAKAGPLNLAPLVIHEVTLLGSRCGPFPEAINALARQAVDVRSMISRTCSIEQAAEAIEAARDPNNIKILLKMNAG